MVGKKSEMEVRKTEVRGDSDVTETDAKSTPASEISEKDAKIIQQVEYYFGDINLPEDKFLLKEVKEDDGWIKLETMTKFNRLAQLTTDFDEIVSALNKSDSGLMEVNADNTKIRRSPHRPLPEMNQERRDEFIARSAYIRRFPNEYKIDDALKFCAEHAPGYESITMRYYHNKVDNTWRFEGPIFITFKTLETCKKFVEGEDIEINKEKLVKMMKNDFLDEKRMEGLNERKNRKMPAKNGPEAKKANDKESKDDALPLGAIVILTGFKDNSGINRESIKAKMEEYGIAISFIDFNIGEQAAWVWLEQKGAAKELAEKVAEKGEKLKIGDEELTLRVLEGDEEEIYLDKAKDMILKRRNQMKQPRKGGHRGGRKMGRDGRQRGGTAATTAGRPKVVVDYNYLFS